MKKTRILARLYDVTPTIVLRCNLFKARHVTQQDYDVTTRKVYAVTLLIWEDELSESALRHHGFVRYPFDYRVTLGFGSIAGGLDHVNPIIRLPLEHEIGRVLGKDDHSILNMRDDVDISTLTIEQYLALIQDKNISGIVKPKIGDDVEFEINRNFMSELRRKFFTVTDDEDAHEHVQRVLEIVDLFHFPGVTHDAVMLRVFPLTLKGKDLSWKKGFHHE
nr:hypothetical protein [Tanacetum cinerariifolium]